MKQIKRKYKKRELLQLKPRRNYHKEISYVKSVLRIIGALAFVYLLDDLLVASMFFMFSFIVAEILGIAEEQNE